VLGTTGPNLLAIHDVLIAITHGASSEVRQVASAIWFTEQLTPKIFARQQTQDVLLFLFFGTSKHNRWSGPTNTDGVGGASNPSLGEFIIDDDLVDGVGL
jgi:hypothetical protein